MATLVTGYAGAIPNRQTDTKEAFAQNIYDMFVYVSDQFVPSYNASVDSINADIATINGYMTTTLGYKNDTQAIRDEVAGMRDIVLDASNYMGDWNSTAIYPSGASVSFTDGHIYYSKHDNNTASPVSEQHTADWYFAGRKTWVYVNAAANYTATNFDFIYCDTSVGSFTVTLPPSPNPNDVVAVMDISSSFGTNSLSIARNGNTIMGLGEDMIIDTNNITVEFIFVNNDWRVK